MTSRASAARSSADHDDALVGALTAVLNEHCTQDVVRHAEADHDVAHDLWNILHTAGFTRVSVPEDKGGSGGSIADACLVLETAARFAAPVPLAENGLLAGWALTAAGLPLPDGIATIAPNDPRDSVAITAHSQGWLLHGAIHRVPYAASSQHVVLLTELDGQCMVVRAPSARAHLTPGRNLAGEPRDRLTFDEIVVPRDHGQPAPAGVNREALRARGALATCAGIAGAVDRVAELTVDYTHRREQFGQPVARFQAVSHHLVRVTEQAQMARIGARTAARNAETADWFFDVAAAKIVAAEAAAAVAASAHQAHGAIGMTKEYELGQLTRRLWSWRDEYGNDRYWSRWLGEEIAQSGPDRLWPRIAEGLRPALKTRP